ncbi:LysR family transcriptional regulator, partial [Escherichia coli]|nr:LysR family transcriptional regulator [Escherichia coli]
MMKIEPSILPSLAWFALIVRAGSFSRAASEMGITRAALSQNLKSLEERLNTKL